MSNGFLTVEDVNTAIYSNQGFWWHKIDVSKISPTSNYTNVKYDFCTVSKENHASNGRKYTVEVDNRYWTFGFAVTDRHGNLITNYFNYTRIDTRKFEFTVDHSYPVNIMLYMGHTEFEVYPDELKVVPKWINPSSLSLNLKQLNNNQSIKLMDWSNMGTYTTASVQLDEGYNLITVNDIDYGWLLVTLLKSDFQFNCTQSLKLGQVNTVALGTDTDYKPNGDMIGDNTPTIKILYNGETITPVYSNGDYRFDLDLKDVTEPSKVKFKVIVEENKVLNRSETDVNLQATGYELITSFGHLYDLFTYGGVGKLGDDITLYSSLTINDDVLLIGDGKTIDCNNDYNLIISDDKVFRAEDLTFTNGVNTIRQGKGSRLELTDCLFTDNYGYGSCIRCDIDYDSLETPDDYITILNGCTFTNNTTAILHGGSLTVEDCSFNITEYIDIGEMGARSPSFLYQTDGSAIISNSIFNISIDEEVNQRLLFTPALFMIGETAVINGKNHSELMDNNQTSFLTSPYNNISSINLTYYYDLISANVTLTASNGYCHAVSGEDYLFKTNVTIQRSE